MTQSSSPNLQERGADAEVTDENHPSRICDLLVLPRMRQSQAMLNSFLLPPGLPRHRRGSAQFGMSPRLDVAPKTNRPGPRGTVVTDITKRLRICDPLTFVRTSRRAPPSRGSQMCPSCLGSVTSSCCFFLFHEIANHVTMVCASPRPPSPPPRRHGRCSENVSACISGNGGHRHHRHRQTYRLNGLKAFI